MSRQSKRIVIVFGDGSFNMSSKGTLSCNTRNIRKKLLEKSKMFGCFTQRDIDNGVHPDLLGERRLVVLDIDEFKTSKNINSPELDVDHEVVLAKQVRGIHAVVVENGMCCVCVMCCINNV